MEFNFSKYIKTVEDFDPIAYIGYVSAVTGKQIVSNGPVARIGEICTIKFKNGKDCSQIKEQKKCNRFNRNVFK